jgi:hypothetical protein
MRRIVLLFTGIALALVLASGMALAVNRMGTEGPDTLRGTNGDDNLLGLGGNDRLFGLNGDDNLLGGRGKDVVGGGDLPRPGLGRGDKNLSGGPGNDIVIGARGSDNAVGGEGNDLLADGPGRESSRDRIIGGQGNDVIAIDNRPAYRDMVACGGGFDRVLADRKDLVAPDCERVSIGLSLEEFVETIPPSFFEGLPPFFQ